MEHRPLIEFKDLVGVTFSTNPDGSCLFEIRDMDVVIHARPCNDLPITVNFEVDHLYYFGMYNGKTILLEHLGEPGYVGTHCFLMRRALMESFPDDNFALLPIHVKDIAGGKVLFIFCNADVTKSPLHVIYLDANGELDIHEVSEC